MDKLNGDGEALVAEKEIVIWWDRDTARWCARAEGLSTLFALGTGDSDLQAFCGLFIELRTRVEQQPWLLQQSWPQEPFDRAHYLRERKDELAKALFPPGPSGKRQAHVGPPTLDEALRRLGQWEGLIRGAIERGEVIPQELFTVSFRRLTASEVEYGRRLAVEFYDKEGQSLPDRGTAAASRGESAQPANGWACIVCGATDNLTLRTSASRGIAYLCSKHC